MCKKKAMAAYRLLMRSDECGKEIVESTKIKRQLTYATVSVYTIREIILTDLPGFRSSTWFMLIRTLQPSDFV